MECMFPGLNFWVATKRRGVAAKNLEGSSDMVIPTKSVFFALLQQDNGKASPTYAYLV